MIPSPIGGKRLSAVTALLCAASAWALWPSLMSAAERVPCACAAQRHPDTASESGPYVLSLQEMEGTRIVAGAARYVVEGGDRHVGREGRSELRRGDSDAWLATLPGQRSGSTVRYHFDLRLAGGERCRFPGRGSYRFRIVPIEVTSVSVPHVITGEPATARIAVRSAGVVTGRAHLRRLPAPVGSPEELFVPLTAVAAEAQAPQVLEASLPSLATGQILDLDFELRTARGETLRLPADAPGRTYTARTPPAAVQPLPCGPALVLDALAQPGFIAAATRGGGALWSDSRGHLISCGLGQELGSNVARFVRRDPVQDAIFVGTDRGVVAYASSPARVLEVVAPAPSPTRREVEALARLGSPRRAGPAALSPLDGALRFQIQGSPLSGSPDDDTAFLELRDGALASWVWPVPAGRVAGLSALTYDPVDGCWLAGGSVKDGSGRLVSTALRDCDGTIDAVPLPRVLRGTSSAIPDRVVGIARDPSSADAIAAVEVVSDLEGRPRSDYGLLRVRWRSGGRPAAPTIAWAGAEITALATDWRQRRVLVATIGKGLLQLRGPTLSPSALWDGAGGEVTALSIDPSTAAILAGGPTGLFQIDGEGRSAQLWPMHGMPQVAPDALPADVDPATGRVLLSSYRNGAVEIQRSESEWRPVRWLRPGIEIPPGQFGDARYGLGGEIWLASQGKGLLRVREDAQHLVGWDDGLRGTSFLRLLARPRGDVWAALTPVPFGPGAEGKIQIFSPEAGVITHEMSDRDLATISSWVDMPERDAIWAATRAGVAEVRSDGAVTLLSRHPVSAIARSPGGSFVGAAGSTIERWDGGRFTPILFRADHPRWPRTGAPVGPPLDLAIDDSGDWFVLFRGGFIAWLDEAGALRVMLDSSNGVPPSAQRLLLHPRTGDLIVGSADEGVVILTPRSR